MVPSDDKVRSAVVLSDDRVPDGLSWATHSHGETEEAEDSHVVGVTGEQGLVDADASEVVDVAGFCEANHGVDKDVGLSGAGGTDCEFSMSSVHRVSAQHVSSSLVNANAEVYLVWKATIFDHPSFSKCSRSSAGVSVSYQRRPVRTYTTVLTSKTDIVVVVQSVESIELSTNVELLCSLKEVLDGWVLRIASKYLLSFQRPTLVSIVLSQLEGEPHLSGL